MLGRFDWRENLVSSSQANCSVFEFLVKGPIDGLPSLWPSPWPAPELALLDPSLAPWCSPGSVGAGRGRLQAVMDLEILDHLGPGLHLRPGRHRGPAEPAGRAARESRGQTDRAGPCAASLAAGLSKAAQAEVPGKSRGASG